MFSHLKADWNQIKHAAPGRRFRECYDRKCRARSMLSPSRVVAAGAGTVLAACGVVLLATPGPGWAVIFLGLALLATAWRPAARLLDWAEPRLRSAASRAKDVWKRLSRTVKLGLSVAAGLLLAAAGYLAYIVLLAAW